MVVMKRSEEVTEEFQKAGNKHDMAALGSLFCEEASFVNRFGHYVRGVREIISLHAPIHESIYSDSTMENEIIFAILSARMLPSSIAGAVLQWEERIQPVHM